MKVCYLIKHIKENQDWLILKKFMFKENNLKSATGNFCFFYNFFVSLKGRKKVFFYKLHLCCVSLSLNILFFQPTTNCVMLIILN